MILDQSRTGAYARALELAVRPGATVLDLGCATGYFAFLACRLGARKVYAIESDPIVHVASKVAALNGLGDRIQVFAENSLNVSLPEKVDVIVSDLRGILPLFQGHLLSIMDARSRFLKPGGILIPRSDTIWLAVVQIPETYHELTAAWDNNTQELDLDIFRTLAVNMWRRTPIEASELQTPPLAWKTLDYSSIDSPHVEGDVEWTMDREAVGHGFAAWFDADLAEGIGFSNAPGRHRPTYGRGYFPWTRPIGLAPGDVVSIHLRANLVKDDYFFSWETRVREGATGEIKAHFQQSSLKGHPLTLQQLRARGSDYVPRLELEGRIQLAALNLMDGRHTLREIAEHLQALCPERFKTWQDALPVVGELSQTHGSASR